MATLDLTKAVDRIRLKIGDTNDLQFFPDAVYQQVLDTNNQDEAKTALDMAQYIYGMLCGRGYRERLGQIEIYGREAVQSYKNFLETFILGGGKNAVFNANVYAGGISKADMAANDANPDVNGVPAQDASTQLDLVTFLRF